IGRVREWLSDPDYPVDMIVTHRFPLDRYAEALSVAAAGPRAGAIKVVLEGVGRSPTRAERPPLGTRTGGSGGRSGGRTPPAPRSRLRRRPQRPPSTAAF